MNKILVFENWTINFEHNVVRTYVTSITVKTWGARESTNPHNIVSSQPYLLQVLVRYEQTGCGVIFS